MSLMFWKKKPSHATEEDAVDDDRTVAIPRDEETDDGEKSGILPGLMARLRNALAALRKPRNPGAETDVAEAEAPGREQPGEEKPTAVPARNLKKRLIVGGAIGLLVVLLAGIGFASWKIFFAHPEQKPATAAAPHMNPPAAYAATPQAEIDALKKKNAELQAQIDTIKKEQPQPPASPSMAAGESTAAPSSNSGEMTLSNKDPKAAAQALKAAIEEMNASSGSPKPHKPAP